MYHASSSLFSFSREQVLVLHDHSPLRCRTVRGLATTCKHPEDDLRRPRTSDDAAEISL
jgi:hypothetical protein